MTFNNDDFHAPAELRTDEFLLRPILASDAALDYEAVMASKEYLRPWEQTGWPADDFTLDANRADVEKLARWNVSGERFTYTVLDPTGKQCLGCVYLVPTDAPMFARKEIAALDGARWSDYAVVVHFWVRTSRLADGLDRRLLDALGPWFVDAWRLAALSHRHQRAGRAAGGTDREYRSAAQIPTHGPQRSWQVARVCLIAHPRRDGGRRQRDTLFFSDALLSWRSARLWRRRSAWQHRRGRGWRGR